MSFPAGEEPILIEIEDDQCVCCLANGLIDVFCINPFIEVQHGPEMVHEKIHYNNGNTFVSERDMKMAHASLLLISMTYMIKTLAFNFRYRRFDSTYYDDGDVLGTNYWKIAN